MLKLYVHLPPVLLRWLVVQLSLLLMVNFIAKATCLSIRLNSLTFSVFRPVIAGAVM